MEQTKFTYSPFGKEFERQIKTIEGPEEKQMKSLEKHGKRLVKSGSEKYFLKLSKLKEIFDELTNEMIDKIKNLVEKLILIIELIILRVKIVYVLKLH